MLKKIALTAMVGLLGFLSLGTTYPSEVSAAGMDNKWLSVGQTTSTTSRVKLLSGEKLSVSTQVMRGDVVFRVFKNGVQYQDFAPTNRGFDYTLSGAGPGEYSLRAYCGAPNNLKTNCSATKMLIQAK